MSRRPAGTGPAGCGAGKVSLQSSLNRAPYFLHIHGGLEAGNHFPLPVHQELGEIPLDVRFLAKLLVVHIREFVQRGVLKAFAKAGKGLFGGQEGKQGIRVLAVLHRSS